MTPRKLSSAQVREIRTAKLVMPGKHPRPAGAITEHELAAKFGVSQTIISFCRTYKTYRDLP